MKPTDFKIFLIIGMLAGPLAVTEIAAQTSNQANKPNTGQNEGHSGNTGSSGPSRQKGTKGPSGYNNNPK